MTTKLFTTSNNIFKWQQVKTFLIRNQYNEMLNLVIEEYFNKQYTNAATIPNFLNTNFCLTLDKYDEKCLSMGSSYTTASTNNPITKTNAGAISNQVDLENKKSEARIAHMKLEMEWTSFRQANSGLTDEELVEIEKIQLAIEQSKDIAITMQAAREQLKANKKLITSLDKLAPAIKDFEDKSKKLLDAIAALKRKELEIKNAENLKKIDYAIARERYEIAERNFAVCNTSENLAGLEAAKKQLDALVQAEKAVLSVNPCVDAENTNYLLPRFYYKRLLSIVPPFKDHNGNTIDIDFSFATQGITAGAVVWLYYYERMGIFKILGALLDDYNYKGKYTISGNRQDKNGNANNYSILLDQLSALHRMGVSSNLRDRICTYQRVLGVSIENNLGIESEQNAGFMQTFDKLMGYMLEYYKTKQLAVAINNANQNRSSVATQTSIRDTMNVLKQQFEPLQYGRNQINTFLGIATVHATLCLINNLRKEIGIPDQYERPEEFIPAAYDILVSKRPVTLNETNRFILYDNCASYGYRLLTDIETVDLTQLSTVSTGGTLDLWLDDVEGLVEGYRNAYASLPESANAIV